MSGWTRKATRLRRPSASWEAFPEHHGGPLEAAWNEVCDGDTETARAFDDALTALKREFDN